MEFSDGTIWGGSALGAVPEDVLPVSEALSGCFAAMTEALPVYVPQVNVSGEVDETLLAAVRDDLLLCVVGSGALFDNTLNAASALGWTTLRTGGAE